MCEDNICSKCGYKFPRPLEDALRAELAAARDEVERLRNDIAALTATRAMKLCPGCEKLTEHEKYCEVWECQECGVDSESGFVGRKNG